eukprot:5490016-Alexandrium_andersonii.AAC.1
MAGRRPPFVPRGKGGPPGRSGRGSRSSSTPSPSPPANGTFAAGADGTDWRDFRAFDSIDEAVNDTMVVNQAPVDEEFGPEDSGAGKRRGVPPS